MQNTDGLLLIVHGHGVRPKAAKLQPSFLPQRTVRPRYIQLAIVQAVIGDLLTYTFQAIANEASQHTLVLLWNKYEHVQSVFPGTDPS